MKQNLETCRIKEMKKYYFKEMKLKKVNLNYCKRQIY